jgi:ADP-heptose:LPS heptosyltransferase
MKILLVAPQGLGDCLEATPLLVALKEHDPNGSIDVVVTRGVARELFEALPEYVGRVIHLPYWERGARSFVRALLKNRRGKAYDAAFLAYPSARREYELLLAAFPAMQRYAHRHAARMLLDLPGLKATLVPVRSVHNVERNRDLLRAAQIAPGNRTGYVVPRDWIAQQESQDGPIAIHVGSAAHDGLAAKRWPLERFGELCRRLVNEGRDVALVVGPEERVECEQLVRAIPGLRTMQGNLQQIARFLSGCSAVVANDGGIAHLAAGVGARVIALFGPTPLEFAPFSPNAIALRPSTCPPCFDVRTPIVRCVRNIDFACLKVDLTVEAVLAALTEAERTVTLPASGN